SSGRDYHYSGYPFGRQCGLWQPHDRTGGWQSRKRPRAMKKLLLLAFLAAACFTPSQGQDTLKVTFEEAITIGLESNQDYQMLQNEQELLRTERQAATAAIFPRVGISNSLTLQSGQQSQLVEGGISLPASITSASIRD